MMVSDFVSCERTDSEYIFGVTFSYFFFLSVLLQLLESLRSAGCSWRLELEWCERKILLGWLELELVAGVL